MESEQDREPNICKQNINNKWIEITFIKNNEWSNNNNMSIMQMPYKTESAQHPQIKNKT